MQINKITAHPTVDFAAEELKKYLRMMMPDCGEIPIFYCPKATDGFRLGLMTDFGLDVSQAQDLELDDILHVDTDTQGGIIAGSNPRSVLLAVYRYLQENGCRWLFPGIDGEYIPMQNVRPVRYHKMADCRFRGQCNEGAEFQQNMMEVIDFTPKIGLNVFMLEFFNPKIYYNKYYDHEGNPSREPEPVNSTTTLQWKRQCEAEIAKRGLQFHDMGHGWTCDPFGIDSVNAWDEGYTVTVPQEAIPCLAMINGKRGLNPKSSDPTCTNACMSNPAARKRMVDHVADYAAGHRNVDHLHVWLADGYNNHCECPACQEKLPSDWYVMLMNELDEELTQRGLSTRIVFICYVDTSWPPQELSLHNPKRFTLLVAPITRDYTLPISPDVSRVTYPPYQHNQNKLFESGDQYVAAGRDWQKKCGVEAMLYEYHFYISQYFDPGVLSFAKGVYQDILGYRANGLQGLINDCSQRSFWPNGFAFWVYGQTLFDTSVSFDALLEDYFSHAYGEDWRRVVELLEKISGLMDRRYLHGQLSANKKVGKFFNPAMAEKLHQVPQVLDAYLPFLQANKTMPYRAQTVAYRLLILYTKYLRGLGEALEIKATGDGEKAREQFIAFLKDFGHHEVAVERYFDQYMFYLGMNERIFKRMEDKAAMDGALFGAREKKEEA